MIRAWKPRLAGRDAVGSYFIVGMEQASQRQRMYNKSNPTEEDEDEQNDEDEAEDAAGRVAPASAVRPGGNSAEDEQNEHDQQNGSEHGAILLMETVKGS